MRSTSSFSLSLGINMKLTNLVKKLHISVVWRSRKTSISGRWSGSSRASSWDSSRDAISTDSDCEEATSSSIIPSDVPEGCLPLYVGQQRRRFVVKAESLNHPLFRLLLDRSAEEFGFDHEGALEVMCDLHLFHHILSQVQISKHD